MSENLGDTLIGGRSSSEPPVEQLPASSPEPVRLQMRRPIDYWLLWLVALGSIALNVWLINTLLTIQRQFDDTRLEIASGLITAANGIGQAELGIVEHVIHIDEQIPLDIAVPVSSTLVVPISHTVRVNSAAVVNLPLIGRQSIPFSVNVPVDLDVTIPVSETYRVVDTVPVKFDVPIVINLDDTPLGEMKGGIQEYLLQLAAELSQGAVPRPGATSTP